MALTDSALIPGVISAKTLAKGKIQIIQNGNLGEMVAKVSQESQNHTLFRVWDKWDWELGCWIGINKLF